MIEPRIQIKRPINDFNGSTQASDLFHHFPLHIQQILQPERLFSDGLVIHNENTFFRQRVDFALESPSGCKWIIEVDGKQHEVLDQANRDKLRDNALCESKWQLARIPASEINSYEMMLAGFMESTRQDEYLQKLKHNLDAPLWEQPNGVEALTLSLTPFAVARIQKVLTYLLLQGIISLNQEEWRVAVIERDVPAAILAFDDYFQLLQQFVILLQMPIKLPQVVLTIYQTTEFKSNITWPISSQSIKILQPRASRKRNPADFDLVIDISVLRRAGLSGDKNQSVQISSSGTQVTIRSGYRQETRTIVATANPISYSIEKQHQEDALLFFLQNIFRKRKFRDGQKKILKRALSRKNTIGLLPTGAGKSLCYQLATLLQPGLTLVIDPLRSLMIDQNDNLRKYSLDRSAYIISDMMPIEREQVAKRFYRAELQFLFISPERLQIKSFREDLSAFISDHPIAYAVIDEAHCVSEWGHDFRTSYLLLSRIISSHCRYHNQPPPIYALTGTASAVVLRDVKMDLGIGDGDEDRNAIITPATFDRPELKFFIYNSKSADKYNILVQILSDISSFFKIEQQELFQINGNDTYSGLIFCPHVSTTNFSIEFLKERIGTSYFISSEASNKICPKCGAELQQKRNRQSNTLFWGCAKYPECKYTSNLSKEDEPEHFKGIHIYAGKAPKSFNVEAWEKYKLRAQKEFINNEVPLMITNKAFGMGIDKPNIRYTIHYCIPQSIEGFYQEAGRAGRDRKDAFCAVLFSDDGNLDADRRLDSKLTIEDVQRLPKVSRNQEGDIHRNLFFQTNSFAGKMLELEALKQILKGPVGLQLAELDVDTQEEVTEFALKSTTEKGDSFFDTEKTEKALYRLLVIGVIEDYTISYRKPQSYQIIVRKKDYRDYAYHLYDYLLLHKADFQSKFPERNMFWDYIQTRPENHPVLRCLGEMLDFVYSVIEPQRRQALAALVAAVRTGDNDKFRAEILRYLSPDETYNQLFWIFPQSTELNDWIEILDKATNDQEANTLLGISLRNLESFPTSVGLRFISAALRLSLQSEVEDYGLDDFIVATKYLNENYPANQRKRILSYFTFYILEKGQFISSKIAIAKILLNEYPEKEYYLKLFHGNYEDEIRKLGATHFLQQLIEPVNLLISHLEG